MSNPYLEKVAQQLDEENSHSLGKGVAYGAMAGLVAPSVILASANARRMHKLMRGVGGYLNVMKVSKGPGNVIRGMAGTIAGGAARPFKGGAESLMIPPSMMLGATSGYKIQNYRNNQ